MAEGFCILTELHTISTAMLANRKVCHAYVLDGRSRASYSVRCKTKRGMIWLITSGKQVMKMKTPNIWFWRPRCVFSALIKERPMKSACKSLGACPIRNSLGLKEKQGLLVAYRHGSRGVTY